MIDKFWSLVGVIFFGSILPIMYFSTMSSGDDVISVLAVKHGVCKTIDSCGDSQKQVLAKRIMENTEYSSLRQIQWCLGADTWAEARSRRRGLAAGIWMDAAYLFCPDK